MKVSERAKRVSRQFFWQFLVLMTLLMFLANSITIGGAVVLRFGIDVFAILVAFVIAAVTSGLARLLRLRRFDASVAVDPAPVDRPSPQDAAYLGVRPPPSG